MVKTKAETKLPIYRRADCDLEARVADLLGRMTLDEKLGQLLQPLGWKAYLRTPQGLRISPKFAARLAQPGGIGGLYGLLRADAWTEVTLATGLTPREGAEVVNLLQRFAIEQSRLGIPLLISEECMHGHMAIGATVFPTGIGIGSTWDRDLARRLGAAIGRETRAQGGNVAYAPDLDLARDPRWSRCEETFGEDPVLAGRLGAEMVRGLQANGVAATLKHLAAYGDAEGGHNGAPAHVGWRELHEVLLAPFKMGVEAGAWSAMVAYNEIDGIPCTCNRELLTDILRRQWGFRGFVVSDCNSVNTIVHDGLAADAETAAKLALEAGMDSDLDARSYREPLRRAVARGLVEMGAVDAAAGNILRVKFALGLFENPYADEGRAPTLIGCREHRELALETARKQIVLLKNEAGVLPLARRPQRLAVIGPNADEPMNQLGDYTAPQPVGSVVTVLDGLRAVAGEGVEIAYARGCRVKTLDRSGFAEAVAVARASDVIVAVVGGSSARGMGMGINQETGAALVDGRATDIDMECGEGFDRADLGLAGVQDELLCELRKLGKPLIAVVVAGRPLAIAWLAEHADAILHAWYPGCEGGRAVAEILFGDICPSGKLPVSIPRQVGQLPVYYYHKRRARPGYVGLPATPLFLFGFGLSYTRFAYADVRVERLPGASQPQIGADTQVARLVVKVENGGPVAGEEIVQLYVRDLVASISRPVRELKDFVRVALGPGERREVSFAITGEMLGCHGADGGWGVEPGDFELLVGGGLDLLLAAPLRV